MTNVMNVRNIHTTFIRCGGRKRELASREKVEDDSQINRLPLLRLLPVDLLAVMPAAIQTLPHKN